MEDALKKASLFDFTSALIADVLMHDLDEPYCVLTNDIKPVSFFGTPLIGYAHVASGGPLDTLRDARSAEANALFFDSANSFSVIVIDAGDSSSVAHFGDIGATYLSKKSVRGAVINGLSRDIAGIKNLNFPLFCRGVTPIDAWGRWQIRSFGDPVYIKSQLDEDVKVKICERDIIFADETGIVVIPLTKACAVKEYALRRKKREVSIIERIEEKHASMLDIEKYYKYW